jgi:hypothetical protein
MFSRHVSRKASASGNPQLLLSGGKGTSSFMWKLQRVRDEKLVVLKLSGRLEAGGLSALRELCASETVPDNLVLDLSEVKLAGQEAVKFLAGCEARGTRLRNCPAYIRDWVTRERNGAHS